MTKVAFFYANGTASPGPFGLVNWLQELSNDIGEQLGLITRKLGTVAGLNGRTATWQDLSPQNDPFPSLLDPNIFEAKKIAYPAAQFPMGISIDVGIYNTVQAINALPSGQPWAVGGYSQGAAVMSSILNLTKAGGSLAGRASTFLGGVMFGNPRRQIDYRGSVGGTWSGAWNVANSTTGGGGSFPATGNYARLTNCDPLKWIEFAEIDDVFTAVNPTANAIGSGWVQANASFINLGQSALQTYLSSNPGQTIVDAVNAAFALGGVSIQFVDAVGQTLTSPGNGHVAFPWRPPPGDPDNGLTSFQIAIKFLENAASAYATAPILLPTQPAAPSSAGWSPTLIPPAA